MNVVEHLDRGPLDRAEIPARVARDIPPGSYVNLGIGQPTAVADHLDPAAGITLHTENGMLGMGRRAGVTPITETPGASYFHHADSFAIMRGGHLDVCVMGAFQVSASGDLANWHTGSPDAIPAVGGAMDLATGAKAVYMIMTLFTKDGHPKLVPSCNYPLTGRGCVTRLYTDYAVFTISPDGVDLIETYGTTAAKLARKLQVLFQEYVERSSGLRQLQLETGSSTYSVSTVRSGTRITNTLLLDAAACGIGSFFVQDRSS